MAHFAQLDDNNVVLQVIVVSDEHEATGEQWCHDFAGGRWKQTSYNSRIRKNYAGPGFTYDESRDAFIPPKAYPSWTLNEETCQWQAPNPKPDLGNYVWVESEQQWILPLMLFYGNYGADHSPEPVANVVSVYALEPFVPKIVYQDADFSCALTLVNNIVIASIGIQNKNTSATARLLLGSSFLEKCNEIQRNVAMPVYAMDSLPNSAYTDITESPAWIIGSRFQFEFYENTVFNDKTYFVLRRTLDKAMG